MKETKTPVANFTTNQINHKKPFTSGSKSVTFCNVLAKSSTEPENSSIFTLADSTPLACFFVRCFFTPKERLESQELHERLSMVVRNGKGSPFAVFQCRRFLSPLRTTAQTLRSLAVVFRQFTLELSTMLFKFLLLGEKRLRITVYANSEQEARQRLNLQSPALCVARLNTRRKGGVYA